MVEKMFPQLIGKMGDTRFALIGMERDVCVGVDVCT